MTVSALWDLTKPMQRLRKNGSGVSHGYRIMRFTPETGMLNKCLWYFYYSGYCLKGSHNIDKYGDGPGKMAWMYWTKKYTRVKNICITYESQAIALWRVVQRLENLAFLCQGCCWLQFRTVSPNLLSYANFFFQFVLLFFISSNKTI